MYNSETWEKAFFERLEQRATALDTARVSAPTRLALSSSQYHLFDIVIGDALYRSRRRPSRRNARCVGADVFYADGRPHRSRGRARPGAHPAARAGHLGG